MEDGAAELQTRSVDDVSNTTIRRKSQTELRGGLRFSRRFTRAGIDPLDEVAWERRSARINNEKGEAIFEQTDVEVPEFWSQIATNVVVSKYFRGHIGTPERESSVGQVIRRVVGTITDWGRGRNYFTTSEDANCFEAELTHLIVHQYGTFNSPVWFNVGLVDQPQCSACFINSVEDNMESILELARTEARLFKGGSGTGTNLSPLRASEEHLSGGGTASGPVSFMKGFDAFAGVIKSGGKTRRAAKMVILDVDHPDILEFIRCKADEERKAWALIDSGFDGSIDGEAYASIFFQNANNSVRVTDDFMRAALEGRQWTTYARTTDEPMVRYEASEVLREISEAAHLCGDPGLQFDTQINDWHTCPNSGRINASNPCSEFMFLDNTACNLASLNLMKFVETAGGFDVESFKHAVDLFVTAQDIIVDEASYPTTKIGEHSHRYRPLGLGYANLGALLMSQGLPYDSDEGRAYAASITALMTAEAYVQSGRLSDRLGSFTEFDRNRQPMMRVIEKHSRAADRIESTLVPTHLQRAARQSWSEAYNYAQGVGFRNAQVSVLAPTGTIAFMMDCDTTGVEPDIALVKYKNLVGGGQVKIVNHTVPRALDRLGYNPSQKQMILDHIDRQGTAEGAPSLKPEDLAVFDCALRSQNGTRTIAPEGHVKMMAAIQPFISGAISKTVNVSAEATVQDVEQIYIDAWRMGLKAIAIYREGSKRTQPLNLTKGDDKNQEPRPTMEPMDIGEHKARRRRLPDERTSITHKFSIAGHEGYITVGMYEDGKPGELFIRMAKAGSVVSGLMDSFALAVSLSLQYGVPLQVLVEKYSHSRFEPSGFTTNPEIPIAKSLMDYIFRWLGMKFITPEEEQLELDLETTSLDEPSGMHSLPPLDIGTPIPEEFQAAQRAKEREVYVAQADAPVCVECGGMMTRSGTCYRCSNCGTTSGCS